MRELFVSELAKEVLGPRKGLREVILKDSPLNEYICGVLAPVVSDTVPDIDSEAAIPAADGGIFEDDSEDVEVNAPPLLSPALDPRSRPSSMGLSFVVEVDKKPNLQVCLTWARYVPEPSDNGTAWKREPRYFTQDLDGEHNRIVFVDGTGKITSRERAELSLHAIFRRQRDRLFVVNLYLVNRVRLAGARYPKAEHHIYQPQIRVSCMAGTRVVPGPAPIGQGADEHELEFLFRRRPSLARGFLCSAIWKDIDPQRPHDGTVDFPDALREPPFGWVDGALLPKDSRTAFETPDIRTEFVPTFSVPMPKFDWDERYGKEPELQADTLAEAWKPDEVRKCLSPLPDGYLKWIQALKSTLHKVEDRDKSVSQQIVEACEKVHERMLASLDLLQKDEDARLAFCFANKSMDLQHRWAEGGKPLVWRAFQLGYMLLTLESIANANSKARDTCDLLWVPTGTGKTEAYLALAAFALALRRRRALMNRKGDKTGAGVSVLTRYTLRLLTIQQFRRSLAMITACEYLRVEGLSAKASAVGWRPAQSGMKGDLIWGSTRFSVGLWVGGSVTPNSLKDFWGGNRTIHGALSILRGERGEGEPAQVLSCPACQSIVAIPLVGLRRGKRKLHFVVSSKQDPRRIAHAASGLTGPHAGVDVISVEVWPHWKQGFFTVSVEFNLTRDSSSAMIDALWKAIEKAIGQADLLCASPSRPGYFFRHYISNRNAPMEYDFEIMCPNPKCALHRPWCSGSPTGMVHARDPSPQDIGLKVAGVPEFPDGNRICEVHEAFRQGSAFLSERIPIPAFTVDDQLYHRIPSMVVATVDKFARPPFEPRAAALFGNVTYHHCVWGYYREFEHAGSDAAAHPSPIGRNGRRTFVATPPLPPPDLILQDELHLIEGPLGSLVGFYETALDFLSSEGREHAAKYVASTATIRKAREQVQAVFRRKLQTFPPFGSSSDDRFFVRDFEAHGLDDAPAGRLYVGICAPGRGPLTPLVRIWARVLQTAWNQRNHGAIDAYWTSTGYFNAVRELAGAKALYRQDIPERVRQFSPGDPRPLPDERAQELSGRTNSTNLPSILELLNASLPDAQDALFTTSMFGTGVDIPRIGLMIVNGQPKTTSAYIQSTGRVGRRRGALVVTFLRASKPRDLNHYELFSGYHRQLHRFVEPVTVYPFAPGVLQRASGPAAVLVLRNSRGANPNWHLNRQADLMASSRASPEVRALSALFETRAQAQPSGRRPPADGVASRMNGELDRWRQEASRHPGNLRYVEYAISDPPRSPVVLGDAQHQHSTFVVVYENAPSSLRHIEETTGFET